MFDRIVMDVLDVSFQVEFVEDRMLPVPGLPHPAPPLTLPPFRRRAFGSPRGEPVERECPLHESPSTRIVRVTPGQRPDRVEMIGQEHDRERPKRPPFSATPERRAEEGPR